MTLVKKGDKGDAGDKGDTGEQGLQGIQGLQGETGERGEQGNSLEFTWSGTELGIHIEGETEYVYVDLKGEKGEQGIRGIQGEQGIQGTRRVYKELNGHILITLLMANNVQGKANR